MNTTTTRESGEFPHAPKIAAGQIWREVDKRFSRHVRIVTVIDETQKAVIHGVDPLRNQKCGPTTQARLSRFNGRRGGYELVREVC